MAPFMRVDMTQAADREDIQRYSSMSTNQVHIHVATVLPSLSTELTEGGLRYSASKGKHDSLSAVGAA